MCVCGMISKPSSIEKEVHGQKKRDRKFAGESTSKTCLDVTLMRNCPYACFLLSISTWNFSLCVAIMHLPNYVSTLGGSNRDIGLLMTSFSIANTIGRLLGSLTISKIRNKCLYGVLGLTGVITSLFVFYSDFTGGTYIFAIQLGMFIGWPNSMMTPLSLRFVGVHKLSEAYGLAYIFCGLGGSTGPVLIGYLCVVTGSYTYSFVVAGVVLCFGCLFGVCSICCKHDSTTVDETKELVIIPKDGHVVEKSFQLEDDSKMKVIVTESDNLFDSYSGRDFHKESARRNATCVQRQGLAGEEADKLLMGDIR
ncbi:monocarboxylate transporter 13-like [Mercenaria mercenaria]|uniref:monocarboxylate transporter 13-like n=1 Tax=Mercenaria mercenaria TaxID=6596 RepID=UPI00234F5344|nr:monocarboxylate transporter 13-like [Mercenaria mercenaria]